MTAVFVDTNVFVYAWDASSPDKQARAAGWIRALWDSGTGRTGIQVFDELYVTLTRKLRPAMERTVAQKYIRTLYSWKPVSLDPLLLDLAWDIEEAANLSFWDALIVAAARQAECKHLLSEDLSHGQEIAGVTITSPFRARPEELDLGN